MSEYFVPTAMGAGEYAEKRSRFLGEVWPVEDEAGARACIESVKKKYYDARHHCWCFRLRGGVERYSDDGEPQGTAGQPMLNVFQREGVENVLCVVTRYFGGTLLGTGGLVRAYTQATKEALNAAGISVVRPWALVSLPCPYSLFERVKLAVEEYSGVLEDAQYADEVTAKVLLPKEQVESFSNTMTELMAGRAVLHDLGERWRAGPRAEE